MRRLPHRYLDYRRAGLGRLNALRYAWLVAVSERRSQVLLSGARS